MKYSLINGDCLEEMRKIPTSSVDMILCDLPYGTSACSWDVVIPFEPLWEQYERIIKDCGAIVLFGSEPFSSHLRLSNQKLYKYDWVWEKDNATNFLNKRYQPGKITENICVFGKMATSHSKKGNMTYNPQFSEGKAYCIKSGLQGQVNAVVRSKVSDVVTDNSGYRYPNNILKFNRDKDKVHPTQKPVELLEYLINTYSNENDLVLDNTMGSGSTGVACKNTNRNFIGIELNKEYFEIAQRRMGDGEK